MLVVTGASGQLGRLVIESLLETVDPASIIAAVRSPEKASDLADRGVVVREADYAQPGTLVKAFAGADKVLLISGNEVGQREVQHGNVIKAAKAAGVGLLGYTSILHCDTSPMGLAVEHKATEALLEASDLPYVLLRNGWYMENYTGTAAAALEHGAVLGCSGEGRICAATRADLAAGAAKVMTSGEDQAGNVYELAGDTGFTKAELAAEISSVSGKDVAYQALNRDDYAASLKEAGLPDPVAEMLADGDVGISQGGLFSDEQHLSQLLGRPTTTLREALQAVI